MSHVRMWYCWGLLYHCYPSSIFARFSPPVFTRFKVQCHPLDFTLSYTSRCKKKLFKKSHFKKQRGGKRATNNLFEFSRQKSSKTRFTILAPRCKECVSGFLGVPGPGVVKKCSQWKVLIKVDMVCLEALYVVSSGAAGCAVKCREQL